MGKKLNIILYIMVLLVLSSFANANLNENLKAWYNFTDFTEQTGQQPDGVSNNADLTTGSCVTDGCLQFQSGDSVDLGNGFTYSMDEFAISIWTKNNMASNVAWTLIEKGASGNPKWGMYAHDNGDFYMSHFGLDSASTPTSNRPTNNKWIHIVYNYNSTHVSLWYNGTLIETATATGSTGVLNYNTWIGARIGSENPYVGFMDDLGIWDRALTESEVLELYNSGDGLFYPFTLTTTTATPTIVAPSPADNSHNKTNVTLNVSHSTLANDVRYYLYFGDTFNLDESDLIYRNVTRNGSEYSTWTTNVSDGNYTWFFKVQNITDGVFSANTTKRTLIIDTVSPSISFGGNNNFSTDNSTVISNYLRNLSINISFYDNNLYQTLINITNSSGVSVYQILNTTITGTTVNYSRVVDISTLSLGNYTIHLALSDSHTATSWDDGVNTKTGISYFEFDTPEKNRIRITSNTLPLTKGTIDLKDRKSFRFSYLFAQDEYSYTLTSNNPITYLNNSKDTNSPHFVIKGKGLEGNWIDFDEWNLKKNDFKVNKISDYEYDIVVTSNGLKEFKFDSIGGLNVVEQDYRFEITGVFNVTAYDNILNKTLQFTSVWNGLTKHTAGLNDTQYVNASVGLNLVTLNATGYDTKVVNLNITKTFEVFTINLSLTNVLDDCSLYPIKLITFVGKDEETDINVNTTLDITLFTTSQRNTSLVTNLSYEFRNKFNYSICTSDNQSFMIDSIMEYGDGTDYTKRKYYLNDFNVSTNFTSLVYLYHLNNTKASEIVFTVYDTLTGSKVPEAFIKILRYYPGENVYRTVEIAKTDEVGQSLGKMVLADVFYKFIIEKPAGTIKLNTEVLRILSLTRSFGISLATNYLDTWNKIHGVSYSTTCTLGTKTCRVTWSDTSNIVQDVTLEVWRITGLNDQMIYSETTAAAAGTISYTIVEDTTGNIYRAYAYAESNTGTSRYSFDFSELRFYDNPFFTDSGDRIASLFPLLLLVIVLVFVLVDWGAVGVTIGALLGLISGSIIGVLPLSPFYFVSFILIGVILIYKLSR